MDVKIVETSLNLRIERGYNRMDYVLSKAIAERQLAFEADVYTNVEYMECQNEEYLEAFDKAGYQCVSCVDEVRHRGILCAVKKEYDVTVVDSMPESHMMHLRIAKKDAYIDLITLRILVAGGGFKDFLGRRDQWKSIVEYIDGLEDTSHLVVTGDFNHGVIADEYPGDRPRSVYNYQMIVEDLKQRKVNLCEIDGMSYSDYMKIDHIAGGEAVKFITAEYKDVFATEQGIGIPDHKLIVAELSCN